MILKHSLKVAHLNSERTFRGGEQQTLYLMKGLEEKGIDNYLICNKNSLIKEKASKFLKDKKILEISMKGGFDIFAILKIRKFIKENGIDIIHCHTSHAHTTGFLSAWGLNIKTVVSRRVDFSIYKGKIKFPNRIKYNFMCDKIVAISEKIKDVLIADGIDEAKIAKVYSGVDSDKIKYAETDDFKKEFNISGNNKIIVNIAALVPHKGQEILIRSFEKVLYECPDTLLLIVGDGELREKLIKLRNSLGLENKIIFTGYRTDIDKMFSLADIFVMSSIEEGLCTSILDALSVNKVVVATDAGGIPEIIRNGETGILVKKCSVESLAYGIIDAIKNFEKYKKKFQNGKDFVKSNFSVEKMVQGNLEVYRELIGLGT